jgi:hypothetical protein
MSEERHINVCLVTSEIETYQFTHRGRPITLVDTPGFDDSDSTDRDILMKLLKWLKDTQADGQKLSGILYLHRIDAPRMQGSSLRNFGTFKQLCGEGFYKNIMLGTTCWDLVDTNNIGNARELQLKEKGGYWHTLLQRGSQIARVPKDRDLARDLIWSLASHNPTFLESQVEMGQGVSLDEVSATKTINPELEQLRAEMERALRLEEANAAQVRRERENRARVERENARKRAEKILRQQEEERERILRQQRENDARRERERMEEMRITRMNRIQAAEERERESEREQKKLDNQKFSQDYQKLCRAREYKLITIIILSDLKICGHCCKLLEDEGYVGA